MLEITCIFSGSVEPGALPHMQFLEIDNDDHPSRLARLRRDFAVHQEVLRSVGRLDDDVGDLDGRVTDVHLLPSQSLVPGEQDVPSCHLIRRHYQ